MFKKVLVANRGECALRIIRTLKELGIKSVAVYSECDRDGLHVRYADEAYFIGGSPPLESYLNAEKIISVAKKAGAEAIHPGYGFLSENASFSKLCQDEGLIFIGPKPEVMRMLGDKVKARREAKEASIPIIPGTEEAIMDADEAQRIGRQLGYPVMLKAKAGGGGRGMRVVFSDEQMEQAFRLSSEEARSAYGDGSLYIEKVIPKPRHIEVQILGDNYGNIVHLFERDCSIQRRYQKIVEETPSPAISEEQRKRVTEYAVRLAKKVGYSGAGTVEFLFDGNSFYFLEVNTRLQVEHPITEEVTRIDLVKKQIEIALGKPLALTQEEIKRSGHAIQFRIYAENPHTFSPSPGPITGLRLPQGAGIRVDSGIFPHYQIPIYYDTLLMKLIVWGDGREEAMERARKALSELEIKGTQTNIPFHIWLLQQSEFINGDYHTRFVEEKFSSLEDDNVAEASVSRKEVKVNSPMPGKIVEILFKERDRVREGETVLIMEAMKMLNEITSPVNGFIKKLYVQQGQIVRGNSLLFVVSV